MSLHALSMSRVHCTACDRPVQCARGMGVRRKANYLTVAPFIYPVCYSASEIQTNEMATEMRNARRLSCANIRDIQVWPHYHGDQTRSARANTRDGVRSTPILRARPHPPPIGVGTLTSRQRRPPAGDLVHQDPSSCEACPGCNASPIL